MTDRNRKPRRKLSRYRTSRDMRAVSAHVRPEGHWDSSCRPSPLSHPNHQRVEKRLDCPGQAHVVPAVGNPGPRRAEEARRVLRRHSRCPSHRHRSFALLPRPISSSLCDLHLPGMELNSAYPGSWILVIHVSVRCCARNTKDVCHCAGGGRDRWTYIGEAFR